jgi:hypothetical protein
MKESLRVIRSVKIRIIIFGGMEFEQKGKRHFKYLRGTAGRQIRSCNSRGLCGNAETAA